MDKFTKRKIGCIALIIGLGLFIWLPIVPIQVVPEVTLKVVDLNGNPMPNIEIIQFWRHWTYDDTDRRENLISDSSGNVTFPQKLLWVSIGHFAMGLFGENVISYINIHASYGPFGDFAIKEYVTEKSWCYPESRCETKEKIIVAKEKKKW